MDALKHIDQFIRDVDQSATLDQVFLALRQQLARFGFEMFTYWLLWPPEGPRVPLYVTSYPPEWTAHYIQQNFAADDMVGRHSAVSFLPFLWSDVQQQKKLTDAQRLVFSDAVAIGLSSGASIPIHGPGKAKATFSVASGERSVDFEKRFLTHRHEIQLLATYAHERILHLGLDNPDNLNIKLTPREIEVLTWTARGKTRWEISEILAVSEETVKTHLVNACQRLGVSNKTHAAATAIAHGLILP